MSSLRRLAKDHAALRSSLPPNYLFPHSSDPILDPTSDELTSLTIYLTGPTSTPYAQGLFLLHLRIPQTYPTTAPTAAFRTKIFHPNVDEKTGAVCLETLKRDWDPKLSLKDILLHISCLLVQPNPDSALNENAGVLVREDYDNFERKARLMTKIHASIPSDYVDEADEARTRGEDEGKLNDRSKTQNQERSKVSSNRVLKSTSLKTSADPMTKENSTRHTTDLPSEPVRKSALGKRPIAELPPSRDVSDSVTFSRDRDTGEPVRKSPKHSHDTHPEILTVVMDTTANKENETSTLADPELKDSIKVSAMSVTSRPIVLRRVSNLGPDRLRTYARVGIRRL